MKAFLIVLACLLTGCAAAPRTIPVETKVAVSVPCKAVVPPRPVMPTESLLLIATMPDFLDKSIAALTAEIALREGYEVRLVAELKSCL